MSERISNCTV